MDTLQYWPFAWKYSMWNATVSVLQLWMIEPKPHVLSHTIDWVYTAFFCSDHAQQIQNLPEEILFSHFVTTLNDAFEIELAQEDEGYKSRSEIFYIPTPLSRAPRVYHVFTVDDFSFNPVNFGQSPTLPEQHPEPSPCRHSLTHHHLVFTSSNDESPERFSEWCSPPSSTDARSLTPREADVSSSVHHDLCDTYEIHGNFKDFW